MNSSQFNGEENKFCPINPMLTFHVKENQYNIFIVTLQRTSFYDP